MYSSTKLKEHAKQYLLACVHISYYFKGDRDRLSIISLCPALGEKHSVIQPGLCPSNLQQPQGKKIQISVIGSPPYVSAEFEIMDIYAKRFGFTPKFKRASSWDKEGGMVDMVGNVLSYKHL